MRVSFLFGFSCELSSSEDGSYFKLHNVFLNNLHPF